MSFVNVFWQCNILLINVSLILQWSSGAPIFVLVPRAKGDILNITKAEVNIRCECLNTWRTENTHTHTHPFNGPLSRTTWVSRYQKGKTNLDFTDARASEWQWHQLGHMQVCTSLQTDSYASNPPLSFLQAGWRMPFLPPNQQRQSTEGVRRITYLNLE